MRILLVFFMLLASSQSLATDDYSAAILGSMYGGIGDILTGSGGVLSAMFLKFNLFMATLAAIWIWFVAAKGIAMTAHDGEWLGKENHTTYTPLRFVIGGALVTPVFGGYSGAQAIMMGAVLMGVSAAGAVWGAASSYITANGLTQTSVRAMQNNMPANFMAGGVPLDTLEKMAKGSLCLVYKEKSNAAANAANAAANMTSTGTSSVGEGFTVQIGPTTNDGFSGIRPSSPYVAKFSYDNGLCGTHTLELDNSIPFSVMSSILTAAINDIKNNIAGEYRPTTANEADGNRLVTDYSIILGEKLTVDAAMNAAFKSLSAASKATNDNQTTQQTGNTVSSQMLASWLGAGAKFASMRASKPAAIMDGTAKDGDDFTNEISDKSGFLNGMLSKLSTSFASYPNEYVMQSTARFEQISNKWNRDPFVLATLKKEETNDVVNLVYGSAINAQPGQVMSSLQEAGRTAFVSGLTVYGAGFAGDLIPAGKASQAIGKALNIDSPLASLFDGVKWIGIGLMVVGLALSMYLAVIPFIHWITGIFSWFIAVAEGMVAAPLWAIAHLSTDGQDLTSPRAMHGYMYVVQVLILPSLMVFGLVIGFYIFEYGYQVIAVLTAWLVDSANSPFSIGGSGFGGSMLTGLFNGIATLSALVFLALMAVVLANKAFSLINVLPESVVAWFGGHWRGGASGLSEKSHEFLTGALIGNMGKQNQGRKLIDSTK